MHSINNISVRRKDAAIHLVLTLLDKLSPDGSADKTYEYELMESYLANIGHVLYGAIPDVFLDKLEKFDRIDNMHSAAAE